MKPSASELFFNNRTVIVLSEDGKPMRFIDDQFYFVSGRGIRKCNEIGRYTISEARKYIRTDKKTRKLIGLTKHNLITMFIS